MLRPQTNGQVESAIKIILVGIQKKIEEAKGTWDEDCLEFCGQCEPH